MPAHCIGRIALAGGIIGVVVSRGSVWLDTTIGVVVDIQFGTLIFART
jgi:hypothetical protein